MNHQPFSSAISQILNGDVQDALPGIETAAVEHPGWVSPLAALAIAAEHIGDWDSAFELWTQARTLLPNAPAIDDGVRRSSLMLLKKATPAKHAVRGGSEVEANSELPSESKDRWGTPVEKSKSEATPAASSPSPLVTPLDFDLTEFAASDDKALTIETPETPQSQPGASDASQTLDELDELIGRLEGARIVPRSDTESVPTPNLDADIEDVASETLAVIYLSQQQFSEAARVFEKLAAQHPDRSDEFLEKAHEARAKVSN